MMGILDIILIGVTLCVAGMLQSAVGFGYALFATPVLVWIGLPLPNIVALVGTCSMIQSIIGIRKIHDAVPWRLSLIATVVRLGGVVLGLFVLKKLLVLDQTSIELVIGGILCVLVAIQLIWRPQPVKAMHWLWAAIAFSTSGLLSGICGMGGPPLVLWSMAHDWSTQKTRGFLFAVFATALPLQISFMVFTFGPSILSSVALGFAFFPLVYLGTTFGLPIGNRMKKNTLRRLAYTLLLFIGVRAVVGAILLQLK